MDRLWSWRRLGDASILILLLMALICRQAAAISVNVDGTECLYEFVFYGGSKVSGNFVVSDQGRYWSSENRAIDFEVTSPSKVIIHSIKGTSGDKFEFVAETPGMYKFCFHNPSYTPEIVSFNVHAGHIPNQQDLAKDEHLDPINVKIAQLRENLESVSLEQRYLRAKEARHRHTNESTRKRLLVYTVAEYILFACASGLQVFYIRHLFSKSVGYNRV
ncbi:transmembrane emp24 domain-containing protein p24beta3-like [Wolffia australiana]